MNSRAIRARKRAKKLDSVYEYLKNEFKDRNAYEIRLSDIKHKILTDICYSLVEIEELRALEIEN